MAIGQRCGGYFRREAWLDRHRLRFECWISTQSDRPDHKIRVSLPVYLNLERQVEDLERKNFLLELKQSTASDRMDDEFMRLLGNHLKFLIFACHPDRDGGGDEANEVCRILLDYREKQKTRGLGGGAGFGK